MEIVLLVLLLVGGIVAYECLKPSQKEKEEQELRDLYEAVKAQHAASAYSSRNLADYATNLALHQIEAPRGFTLQFAVLLHSLIKEEYRIFVEPPPPQFDVLDLREQVNTKKNFLKKKYFHDNEETIISALENTLLLVCNYFAARLPKVLAPSPFVIPTAFTLTDTRDVIDRLYGTLVEQAPLGIFENVSQQLLRNWYQASGKPFDDQKKPFVRATKYPGTLLETVEVYCHDTPFYDFFMEPVPLQLRYEELYSHVHVLGASGSGKTQLLQELLLHFLTQEDRPSIIVVDSQGDLIGKLLRLDLPFDPILITPKDIDNPPAINVFDVKNRGYGPHEREQVVAGVIQTFDYLFSELFGGMDMTGKQQTFFRYSFRLLMSLPETMGRNATILDMLALMDSPLAFAPAIAKLPDLQREFFEKDFTKSAWTPTKEQIRYRLQAVLENPTLARLLTSQETKLDFFAELSNPEGSLILIDTAKDFLKSSSSVFGKLMISLVFQAILERAVIPEAKRKPTFLFVDEASQYFSTQLDEMLSEIRKYKCGIIAAHQYLDQCSSQLRSSLMANTSVKLCGSPSVADATSMSREMRCAPDFILSQPRLHFACHIRNVTPQAVSIPIEAGKLEARPKLSEERYRQLIDRNRKRVCAPRSLPPPPRSPQITADPGTGRIRE